MKKLILRIFLILIAPSANGQLLNADFENWNITAIDTTPSDWFKSSFGTQRSNDAYSGQYAIEVWNWYYYGRGYITNSDSFTLPIYGNFETKGGFAINTRPSAFTGYYKYIPGDNGGAIDSAVVMVSFRHRNTNGSIDTIAFAQLALPFATNYTAFTLPISYQSALNPDTVVVSFLSSVNGFCNVAGNGNCLYFTVDAIGFTGITGIELLDEDDQVIIYPNPVRDHLTIQLPTKGLWNLIISDVQGKYISVNKYFYGNNLQIETNDFTPGIYFYCLKSEGETYNGKFIVEK